MEALKIVEDRDFGPADEVSIDGHNFVRCRLVGCLIAYAGGQFKFTECDLRPGGFALDGPAASTVDLLIQLGIRDLSNFIRGGRGPEH